MTVAEIIKGSKLSRFVSYNGGLFLYETDSGYKFTIPLSDLGNAVLLAEDKTMLFLRYIRKQEEERAKLSKELNDRAVDRVISDVPVHDRLAEGWQG